MDGKPVAPPYPRELDIRYPKVSETNPTVQFYLLNLASLESANVPIDAFPADNLIIGEVVWVTSGHDSVLYRAFNRVQDQDKHVLVKTENLSSRVVRERDGTDGWLDNTMAISYIGDIRNPVKEKGKTYYVDKSDMSGWAHIYLFPVDGGKPIQLTDGEWEVASIAKIDTARSLIYFIAAKHHSTERHLYSVSYHNNEVRALVDENVPASWSASFSSGGGYYLLSYRGPDVPYQDLFSIESDKPLRTITSNADIVQKLREYKLPNITFFELTLPTGESVDIMQRLPANFSPSKKYPVLFTPYGGPGSQEVTKVWQALDWNAYISSDPELEYITWTVDNRGSGSRGRTFRSLVTKQLGRLEAEDQVFAAREIAKIPWVDAERIGIWGWSYGGYLTAKTLETDSEAFSFGISTAPVSDWRFYDSMYTERYMKTLEMNPEGYNASAVVRQAGFNNVRGSFLIQHGTGDDNVHFQHAAVMTNTLMDGGVSPTKLEGKEGLGPKSSRFSCRIRTNHDITVQWFTDSDHNIRFEKDGTFLYKQLTAKLFEEKNRKFDAATRHQWSRRHFHHV
jgi:dipeptidyl-peptidase-4